MLVLVIAFVWTDILLFSLSGGNDHATRFWCRNRPGDLTRDKFNSGQIQGCFDSFSACFVFGLSCEKKMGNECMPSDCMK